MEATKKLTGKSVKKWLGNNAIIVLMLLVSLFVGIIHPNRETSKIGRAHV